MESISLFELSTGLSPVRQAFLEGIADFPRPHIAEHLGIPVGLELIISNEEAMQLKTHFDCRTQLLGEKDKIHIDIYATLLGVHHQDEGIIITSFTRAGKTYAYLPLTTIRSVWGGFIGQPDTPHFDLRVFY